MKESVFANFSALETIVSIPFSKIQKMKKSQSHIFCIVNEQIVSEASLESLCYLKT